MTAKVGVEIVDVTPQMAKEWLASNPENRRLDKGHAASLARDMQAGNWRLTGQSIQFGADGLLKDGQHRLQAVILANMSVPMLVVRGLDNDVQQFIDINRKRSLGDILQMQGYANGAALAATLRLLMSVKDKAVTHYTSGRYTNIECIDFLHANPEVVESTREGIRISNHVPMHPSPLAACHYLFSKARPDLVDEFFYGLDNMYFESPKDPRAMMLRKIQQLTSQPGFFLRGFEQVRYLIHTWNLWVNAKQVSFFRIEMKGFLPQVEKGIKRNHDVIRRSGTNPHQDNAD